MDTYNNAKTAAELFPNPTGRVTDDFKSIMNISTAPNSVLGTTFHVVYGAFGTQPYGAGNNLLFRVDDSSKQLLMCGFNTQMTRVRLGGTQSSSSNEIVWDNGVVMRKLSQTVTKDGITENVWNLSLVAQNKVMMFNYFLVPVSFA